jgi:hypothetical protein
VAVKIVDKTDIDPDNLQKVWREIEIMRQLAHKHIIQLYQASFCAVGTALYPLSRKTPCGSHPQSFFRSGTGFEMFKKPELKKTVFWSRCSRSSLLESGSRIFFSATALGRYCKYRYCNYETFKSSV